MRLRQALTDDELLKSVSRIRSQSRTCAEGRRRKHFPSDWDSIDRQFSNSNTHKSYDRAHIELLKPKDLIVEDKLEASKTAGGRAVQSVADEPAAAKLGFRHEVRKGKLKGPSHTEAR